MYDALFLHSVSMGHFFEFNAGTVTGRNRIRMEILSKRGDVVKQAQPPTFDSTASARSPHSFR